MASCINTSSKEFKDLLAETGLEPLLLETSISKWQQNHPKLDRFPTSIEIKDEVEDTFQAEKLRDDIVSKLTENKNKFEKIQVENSKLTIAHSIQDQSGKTERYADKTTGEILQNRVTDEQTKLFVKKVGLKKAHEINNSNDSIIGRDTGIQVHAANEAILISALKGSTSKYVDKRHLEDIPSLSKEQVMRMSNLTEAQYLTLYTHIHNIILPQITESQKKINPNGKFTLIPEALLVDNKRSLGGSADVLVLFSNATATILDFKTFRASGKYVERGRLIDNPIEIYKIASWEVQMAKYKEILTGIGIKGFVQTRVVPYRLDFQYKGKTEKSERNTIINKLNKIEVGTRFLDQVLLTYESTGNQKLDEQIRKQQTFMNNLIIKVDQKILKGKDKLEAEIKIKQYQNSLNTLRLKKDVSETLTQIKNLINKVDKTIGIDDKSNKGYLSDRELILNKEELEIFLGLNTAFINNPEIKLNEEDTLNLMTISGQINHYISEISSKQIVRAQEHAIEIGEDLKSPLKTNISRFARVSEKEDAIHRVYQKDKDKANFEERKQQSELLEHLEGLKKRIQSKGYNPEELTKNGKLINKLTKEFEQERNEAFREGDTKWLLDHYEFKEGYGLETYEKRLKEAKERYKEQGFSNDEVEEKIKHWIKFNNWNNPLFWTKGNWWKQMKMKDSFVEANKSDIFKALETKPELVELYDFYQKKLAEFRRILGIEYGELPQDFIPNIKKGLVERLMTGSMSMDAFLDAMKIDDNSETLGKLRNSLTGEEERIIPIYFLKELETKDKSNEIMMSLQLFGNMVYHYQAQQRLEASQTNILYLLENNKFKEYQKSEKGELIKHYLGQTKEVSPEFIEQFKGIIDHDIYGLRDSSSLEDKSLAKDLSMVKALKSLNQYVVLTKLAGNVIGASGAYIASAANTYFESTKKLFYSEEALKLAAKAQVKESLKYLAVGEFIQAYAQSTINERTNHLKFSLPAKIISTEIAMKLYSYGEEGHTNRVQVAIMQDWGIDENGNLRKLDKINKDYEQRGLKKIAKSLWDLTTYNEETGEVKIEGATDNTYIMLRNVTRKALSGITGLVTDDDTNYINTTLLGNMLMTFKKWMPGMYGERFRGVRYDKDLDLVQQGRYTVFARNLETNNGVKYLLAMVGLNSIKLLGDISTFGFSQYAFGGFYKINEELAKREYLKYLENNPDVKDLKFEDFVQMKQGQVKAMIIEFRTLLLFAMMLVMAMGDWDDDGEKDYKNNWALRQFTKTLNKAQMELGFATSWSDFTQLIGKGVFPISSILFDLGGLVSNTLDEGRDDIFGENSPQDKTGPFYYTRKFIPGWKLASQVADEVFPQDSKIQNQNVIIK